MKKQLKAFRFCLTYAAVLVNLRITQIRDENKQQQQPQP